jgi:hypothetical protein
MMTGSLRLTRHCPSCRRHRVGKGTFICRPCWHVVPEKEKAAVWAAVLAAVAAASEALEATS